MAKKLMAALFVFVTVLLLTPLVFVFTVGLSYEDVWRSPDWAWVAPTAAFVLAGLTALAKRG